MVSEQFSDYKNIGWVLVFGLFFVSCAAQESAVTPNPNIRTTAPSVTPEQAQQSRNQRNSSSTARGSSQSQPKVEGPLNFTYETQTSSITIPLDPSSQEFVVQLSGSPRSSDGATRWDNPALVERRMQEVRKTLKHFVEAQELLYQQRYNEAMQAIDRSIEVAETAHALALKGTIHFMMGNSSQARAHWSRAVMLDPDIPLPSNMPELERIIQQVRGNNQ